MKVTDGSKLHSRSCVCNTFALTQTVTFLLHMLCHIRDSKQGGALQAAGVSTVCIYASHLLFRVRKFDPPLVRKPFSVRVLIPCYKEDIETLEETVECAIEAAKAAMTKGQTNAGL